MSADYTVASVMFGEDGIRIGYMASTDVRDEGAVYQDHTIAVSWATEDKDLLTLMEELDSKAGELVRAAVLRWAQSKPVDLIAERQKALDDADDDNDEGLGG